MIFIILKNIIFVLFFYLPRRYLKQAFMINKWKNDQHVVNND